MSDWGRLRSELDTWAQAGRRATFWWRDDDAGPSTPELRQLLDLSAEFAVSVCLAVIPEDTTDALVEELGGTTCHVLQHGLGHRNLAPAGHKKSEFGPHRPVYERLADVAIGFEGLRQRFPLRHLPVFVPPWNRIGEDLLEHLPLARIEAISGFKPRAAERPVEGLLQVNCHVDPIDWRGSRGFIGQEPVLSALVEHLEGRRLERYDADEPTGILTHHRIHDGGMWSFLHQLLHITCQCDGAHWLTGAEVFRVPG